MHATKMECIQMFLGEAAYPTICYINYDYKNDNERKEEYSMTNLTFKKHVFGQVPVGLTTTCTAYDVSMCVYSITCM